MNIPQPYALNYFPANNQNENLDNMSDFDFNFLTEYLLEEDKHHSNANPVAPDRSFPDNSNSNKLTNSAPIYSSFPNDVSDDEGMYRFNFLLSYVSFFKSVADLSVQQILVRWTVMAVARSTDQKENQNHKINSIDDGV